VRRGAGERDRLRLDSWHLFDVLRVATAWVADGGVSGWYDADLIRRWEEEILVSGFDEHLRSSVAVLLRELVEPQATDPARLSLCCLHLSDWALERKAEGTSLAFCRTAALVWPTKARLERALRIAARHGLRTLEGEIYHDRFTVAFVSGEDKRVVEFARAAYERYLPAHERLPALAYDVAYYWLTRGMAARALLVLGSLLPHFQEPHHRFQVYAATARAAGALGDRATFQSAWLDATGIFSSVHDRTALAAAILDLGYGAAHLEDWEHAETAFIQAEEIARVTGHAEDLIAAEAALTTVRQRANPDPLKLARTQGEGADLSHQIASHLAAVHAEAAGAADGPPLPLKSA
jgi:hypothetical protein